MKIHIELLSKAIQKVIDNSALTYDEIVVLLQNEFPNVNVQEYLNNFILGLQYAYMKQISANEVKQWILDLYNNGISVEEITQRMAETVATAFMKFFEEPVYILKKDKIIYTATNPIIEQIYKDKIELAMIESQLQENYQMLVNAGFTSEQIEAIAQNISAIDEYIRLEQRSRNLKDRIEQSRQEVV